jgi:hypothetical protein
MKVALDDDDDDDDDHKGTSGAKGVEQQRKIAVLRPISDRRIGKKQARNVLKAI